MKRTSLVVVSSLLALFLAAPATAQWNAQSLFTEDGVEVGLDARVFALFSMFNGIGYDVDDRLGPAPLFRPQYSAARTKIRQNLGRRGSALKALEDVLAKHPLPVEDYVVAALELGPPPSFDAKGKSPLAQALATPMAEWFGDEGGAGLMRIVAEEVKPTQKRVLPALDKSIKATTKLIRLGDAQDQLLDDSGPQGRVIVVVNELDRHRRLQIVKQGDVTYVVTGALEASSDEAVVNAATLAYSRTLVWREAQKIGVGTLGEVRGKLDDKTKARFEDEKAVAAELLSCAFMKKVRGAAQCADSPLAGQPGVDEALAALAPRVDAYAGTSAALSAALAELLAPLPPPPPAAPPPDEGKGKGKGKGAAKGAGK